MKNFFDTSHLEGNLVKKTVQGGMAIGVVRVVNLVISLGSIAILARLLRPEDFGLVAMVWAILGFVMVFREAGLSLATVQKKDVTHEQVSNLFWVNLGLGVAIAILIVSASPIFSVLYNDPRLAPIAAALSVPAIFSGLTIQHQALARRHMKFWLVQISGLCGSVLGIATAIFVAWKGGAYWALVGQRTVSSAATCAILWMTVPWRPGLPRRGTGVRSMLQFGANIMGGRFIKMFPQQLDKILIGSIAGEASLGFYSKAKRLMMLPLREINNPANSVTFPALSRVQDDPKTYKNYYYQGIKLLVSLVLPAIICLAIVADDLVPVFLGKGWGEVVIFFRVLAPAAFILSLESTQAWGTVPLGQAGKRFRCQLIDAALTVISFIVGINWGALGVAVAYSLSSVVKFIPLNVYALRESPVSVIGLLRNSLWQPMLFSFFAASGTLLLKVQSDFGGHFNALSAQILLFCALYVGIPFIFPKGRSLFEPAIQAARVSIKKRKPAATSN